MTQIDAAIAIATLAITLMSTLMLLRAEFHGRRPFLALARRWVATSNRTASLVLTPIFAIAFVSLVLAGGNDSTLVRPPARLGMTATHPSDAPATAGPEFETLRTYAAEIADQPVPTNAANAAPVAPELPTVETMIAKLVARLDEQPDDVRGWKMLGWSYLNTDRPEAAAKAYAAALKLDANDPEIAKGLAAAKQALNTGPSTAPTSAPTVNPSASPQSGIP